MFVFYRARQPTCISIWLTTRRYWKRAVDGGSDRVKQTAYEYAHVCEPTSDFIRFEQPKVKKEQRQFYKERRRATQIGGS